MAWTEFDLYGSLNPLDSSRILFSRSVDGGATWSQPHRISDEGGNCLDQDSTVEGAVPSVGPNGEIYIAWAGPKGIVFDKSLDGGLTFGNDIVVTSVPGGWDFGIPGIFRSNGLPVTACDISNSARRGWIYVLWADQRNGEANTDVFLVRSTDGGSTWSNLKKVNNDVGSSQQFFPWLAVDQSSGILYAVFYDRRNTTPGDSTTEVYLAKSNDGGDSWMNVRISQSSFLPKSSTFFGDYISIAAMAGKIYPIWMRLDGSSLSVWTALVAEAALAVDHVEASPSRFWLSQNFPNPFNTSTTISFSVLYRATVSMKVLDVLGREIQTVADGEYPAGSHSINFYSDDLPSGIYFYRLSVGNAVETRKMIIAK